MSFLIFDFDGTLVDSYKCMVEKFTHLADEFKFKRIDPAKLPLMRDMGSMELLKYLEIPFYKIPLIIRAARRLLREVMPDLQAVDGLREVVRELHDTGCTLGIVTSNSAENVEFWLKQQGLRECFMYIESESRFFSKHRILKKIIKRYKVDAQKSWYIGDETRDIEAGKEAGVKTAAVTWGYNSEKALKRHHPDLIIHTPVELLSLHAASDGMPRP